MVWNVILVVISILIVAALVGLFFIEQKQNRISNLLYSCEFPDKWILPQNCTMLIRVRGDFWIDYNSKEKTCPYSIVCGNIKIASYSHVGYCKQLLAEIASFMFDEGKKVFVVNPIEISRFDCAVERANGGS